MTTISSGTTVTVSSGTQENNDIVLAGGTLVVQSGGLATNTTLSGGTETVSAGGVDANATVSSGGVLNILGTAGNVFVDVGGTENISSGGSQGGPANFLG